MTSRTMTGAVLAWCAFGVLAGAPRAGAAEPVKPSVPVVEKGPSIDGRLDDAVWQKALALRLGGYCDAARRAAGQEPADATDVKLLTDREHLYVAFRCEESHSEGPWVYENARFKRRGNAHVMGGDYVALALDMGRWGLFNYTMFFVNAKGELYKCFTWPHRYDLILRDLGLPAAEAAAAVDRAGNRWTAELKIPLKDLLRHPADGFPSTVGVDLRRVQWGAERGKHELKIYWTGAANVTGNRIKPHYDHMATWKPLFQTYPDYRYAYAAGRGWVQLIFPESFGLLNFEAGRIANKPVSGQGDRLTGLIASRSSGWWKAKETRARLIKVFDAPRMEYWADLRPSHPHGTPAVVSTAPVRKPGVVPRFTEKPSVKQTAKETRIAFTVSVPTDVVVAIVDAEGRTVRHLASGVLGPNPPKPFTANSLAQTVAWDRTDDFGRPVKAGRYTARVSLGLKPAFQHAIPIDSNNWWYQDKTPTEKGLDIENLPNPRLGKTLGHFSRGTMNYLGLDRDREELYVQTRYVHDGTTGRKLRDLNLQGPRPFAVTEGAGNGEIFVSRRDGLLYVGGANEVWRFDRDGKPVPFSAVGRHFIPELWGAHSNPHRGLCVGLDGDIYKVHHYLPHTSPSNQVTRIGNDGRIKAYGFIEIRTSAAGVKVDREGNVYVGCTIQPPDALPPKDLASKMPEKPRGLFKRVYGSIVKFGPEGGIIKPDPKGTLACPGPRGLRPFVAQGAKWVHPGYSPMLSRISDSRGGPGCSCRNARFDLDAFGRLFIPDAVYGRIEVTDSNANTIRFIGRRGTAEADSNVELGWPTQVAASDRALYIADYLRYRIVRVQLDYETQADVAVTVSAPPPPREGT